jgi:histidine triad (HIT) family protein
VVRECVFCRIVRGELPAVKVYENDLVVAFLDIYPINPGHTLVVPKRHVERLEELSDEEARELVLATARLAPAIVRAVKAEGYNIVMNIGRAAGQEIEHLHLHIIPRFSNDGCRFDCRRLKLAQEELERIGENIKKAFAEIHHFKAV